MTDPSDVCCRAPGDRPGRRSPWPRGIPVPQFGWLAALGIALILIGLGFRSQYKLVIVSGTSMLPTLRDGDVLVIDQRIYTHTLPARGDIVVARSAWGVVVKRVVGLPGEQVALRKGQLYINGAIMPEQHRVEPGDLDIGEGRLFPGDFATLGDNRAVNPAGAVHPIVTQADIRGKVVWAWGRKIS
jgi:signal peptidase I